MPNTNPIFRPSAVQLIEMIRKLERRIRVLETSEGIFDINNENTPATLGASQNNYDPGNYDILRISSSLAVSITGISGGVKGRRLQLFNVGSYAITLSNLNASSSAANRFNFVNASDFVIPPNGTALLYYDSTQDYWIGGDMSSIYDVVNENTPAQITADQNNYSIGLYEVLRLSSDADRTITGISGGVKGRFLDILNVGVNRISFTDEDANSSAANRFALPYDEKATLLPNARASFYYDSTQQRWTLSDAPNIQGIVGKNALLASSSVPYLQTVNVTTYTKLAPDVVLSDDWSYWDSTNKKFVVPAGESGLYTLSINFIVSSVASGTDFFFLTYPIKNATAGSPPGGDYLNYHRVDGFSQTSYGGIVNLNYPILLDSGDDMTVYLYHNLAAGVKVAVLSAASPILTFSKVG